MACDDIRSKLNDALVELQNCKDENEGLPPGRCLQQQNRVNSLRSALRACEESLIPNTPVPLTLTLTNFVCLDQSDDIRVFGFNVEDDEPYALVFAVDLKTNPAVPIPIPVGASNSKMTLVGPLRDVDLEDRSAPANIIWGLSNAPDMVTSANDLIVLVAMMENDEGLPARARTVLELAAQEALLANLIAFTSLQIPRQELVSRIITNMAGAMTPATVAVDPDDNIGAIQELRFSQDELDHIYRNLGPIEKSLTFEGDDAKYDLKFRMFR